MNTKCSISWPTLYKNGKNGKINSWSIKVCLYEDSDIPVIIRVSGFVGFKQKTNKKYIKKGTNIGKKNERSAWEQAKFIANNYHIDHIKDNWVDDINKVNDQPKYLKPMLAKPFKKIDQSYVGKSVQPKYNGVRAVSFRHINDMLLRSRERNVFDQIKHINDTSLSLFGAYSPDGELYNHDMTFQQIVRRVKKYREGETEKIEYWVYDLAVPDLTFNERYDILSSLLPEEHKIIKRVPTYSISSYEEFKQYHDDFVKSGYEGIILRDDDSLYGFNDRPNWLQKYKEFFDNEFIVVDYTKEEWYDSINNVTKDLVIWICETETGERFTVRPKGGFLSRQLMYNNAEKFIKKPLTVRYQEYSENGTPIFGVGLSFRDYE